MNSFPFIKSDRTFIIAEIGVNHNGDEKLAKQLIDVAVKAGADAVKFQTFKADKLASKSAKKAKYQTDNDPTAESQQDMLRKLELPYDALQRLAKYCKTCGIEFLSTPFDEQSADSLNDLGVRAFKVSSGDLTALDFLAYLSNFKIPMIISTGMGNLAETAEAVQTIQDNGNPPLAILHCVSNYPAAAEDANLRAMDTISQAFGVPVGWSDHTLGNAIAVAAVARGAKIIEKHFTLDVNLPGPDHKASLTPEELTSYISDIRKVEVALGDGIKKPRPVELDTIAAARRSLVLSRDVKAGSKLTPDDVIAQRPGNGIAPKHRAMMVGRTTGSDLEEGHVLSWDDLA